jgi:tetratricopeptide (TPR) repeat protein
MAESVDHGSKAKKHLKIGLQCTEKGDVDGAIEKFYQAAVEFEKAQDFRQIPSLWEAVANIAEKKQDSPFVVTDRWPVDYHVMEKDTWDSQKDPIHKLAWVYQWAAQHRERVGDYNLAYVLFLRSAIKVEQFKEGCQDITWPARMYHLAAVNYIRTFGTIDHAPDSYHVQRGVTDRDVIKNGLKKMEEYYLKLKDTKKAYALLSINYRVLKSNLMEKGNLIEARYYKNKEHTMLSRYYLHNKRYFTCVVEWLAGTGFFYFLLGSIITIIFLFPFFYTQWNLISSATGNLVTYFDGVLFSLEAALGVGQSKLFPVGYGVVLILVEALITWLVLGIFLWWVTKRLE